MPNSKPVIPIDITLSTKINESFRVANVSGMFDVPLSERSTEHITAELPEPDSDWSIGVIVGPSGSGKSSIADHVYKGKVIRDYKWSKSRAVLDDFPKELSVKDISQLLNAVGFSSPPAWVRPYHVLSTGQQFRCNLARALCEPKDFIAFDEFTSVVDRQVAKVGSHCIAKTVRKHLSTVKKFVAITCHYDILDWLEPDWVLDMATRKLEWGRVRQRPEIKVNVFKSDTSVWPFFANHHYLNRTIGKQAWCYVGFWNTEPVSFVSTIQTMRKRMRRMHRAVTLPDYQGLGIGGRVVDVVAQHEYDRGYRVVGTTANPQMIRALRRSSDWVVKSVCNNQPHVANITNIPRLTGSFEFKPKRKS